MASYPTLIIGKKIFQMSISNHGDLQQEEVKTWLVPEEATLYSKGDHTFIYKELNTPTD